MFCKRYGLPTPVTNTYLFGYEVDALFPVERVIVELDGRRFHGNPDREARRLHKILEARGKLTKFLRFSQTPLEGSRPRAHRFRSARPAEEFRSWSAVSEESS